MAAPIAVPASAGIAPAVVAVGGEVGGQAAAAAAAVDGGRRGRRGQARLERIAGRRI